MGEDVTIYATLVSSRKFADVVTYIDVNAIDGCEELRDRFIKFVNTDDQGSSQLTMDRALSRIPVPDQFHGKVLNLCTPWWIINKAFRRRFTSNSVPYDY